MQKYLVTYLPWTADCLLFHNILFDSSCSEWIDAQLGSYSSQQVSIRLKKKKKNCISR